MAQIEFTEKRTRPSNSNSRIGALPGGPQPQRSAELKLNARKRLSRGHRQKGRAQRRGQGEIVEAVGGGQGMLLLRKQDSTAHWPQRSRQINWLDWSTCKRGQNKNVAQGRHIEGTLENAKKVTEHPPRPKDPNEDHDNQGTKKRPGTKTLRTEIADKRKNVRERTEGSQTCRLPHHLPHTIRTKPRLTC